MKTLLAVPSPVEAAACVSLFEEQGWSVTLAGTGKAAIAQAERQAFDLIILDTELPQISGMNVLKRLRDRPEGMDVPVILIAPNADMGLLTLATKRGVKDVMVRPINREQLAERARRYVPEAGAAPQAKDKVALERKRDTHRKILEHTYGLADEAERRKREARTKTEKRKYERLSLNLEDKARELRKRLHQSESELDKSDE